MIKPTLVICSLVLPLLGCAKKANPQRWQTSIQQTKLTGDQFTQLVVAAIREALPDANVQVDQPLRIQVETDAGQSVCNLDNAWRECATDPEIRVDVVIRHVEALQRAFAAGVQPLDLKDVVPVVRDERWIRQVRSQGMQVYHERLAADLFVTYAVDASEQLRFVNQDEFLAFKLSPEDMRRIALSNLADRLPKVQRLGEGPLYMLAAGGTFESSLLLLPGVWEEQQEAVDGRLLVAVPSRELLLFTGENSQDAVRHMRRTVANILSGGNYLISDTILVRERNRWTALPDELGDNQ